MKRPWRQGSLDGLCGVYALINGVRFIEPKINEDDSLLLFSSLIEGMGEVGLLLRSVWRGLTARELIRLLPRLREIVQLRFDLDLTWERPFRRERVRTDTYVEWLRAALEPNGEKVVLLSWSCGGAYWHWSAAHRVSRHRIHILDSGPDPLKLIAISHCSVSRTSRAPYMIEPGDTIRLLAEPALSRR
jgi:hypothetical protein